MEGGEGGLKYCNVCGMYTDEVNGVCYKCGNKHGLLASDASNHSSQKPSPPLYSSNPPRPVKKDSKASVLFFLLVMVVIGIVVGAMVAGQGGKSNNNYDTTYQDVRPNYMTINLYNDCDLTIHVQVWVDNQLKCNDYIGTGILDSPAWITPPASNSEITVKFCIAAYGVWTEAGTIRETFNNGDVVSIHFYPDLTMKYESTKWS